MNEGLIEWPPSPWRLLRALCACGFCTQQWGEIPAVARELIHKLAEVLPLYCLPAASTAHSRHYMPYIEGKNQKTTLIFDTWADVGDGELLVRWPCELNDDEMAVLRQLASSLGYLGRSESWVEADLVADEANLAFNAFPDQEGINPERTYEQISLMAAIPDDEYVAWRRGMIESELAAFPLPAGGKRPSAKLRKSREGVVAPYPPDLLSCLTKDTAWWKAHRWSQPPGSRRVLYWRLGDSLQVTPPRRPKRTQIRSVTTALLSFTTPSGARSSLPPCTRTLPQAELFHRAVVGRIGKGYSVSCPEITGRDEDGQPLRGNHTHAHFLPLDLDGDGHLDHLLVYAQMGLGEAAQKGISTLRRTWTKGGVGEIQLAVIGHGRLDILRQLPPPLSWHAAALLGSPNGSRVWDSITPFVAPRHLKARGKNSLTGQINAELASRGMPAPQEVIVDRDLSRELRKHIRTRTHGGAPPPVNIGYGLRLIFSESVFGPLMLGYASHYGLGLFRSCED